MYIVYGSPLCPDCAQCKSNFDRLGIEYEFRDVTGSMRALHEFLDMRDHDPFFDHAKEIGDIGLPTILLEDGSKTMDWERLLKEQGHDIVYGGGKACSLNGKGC